MKIKIKMFIQSVIVILLASQGSEAIAAERYLVPVYARGLKGATGEWYSKVVVTNPQRTPVNFFVSDVYPVTTRPCPDCTSRQYVLNPGASTVLTAPVFDGRSALDLGSFVIESDKPIVVESTIHLFQRGCGGTQRIEIIRELIPEGVTAWLPDVLMDPFGRTNLFFINPNPFPVTAKYEFNFEIHELVLAPRSTTLVNFPYPQCGNSLCPTPLGLLPLGFRFDVSADGDFYAFASVIWEGGDALFRGAVIPVE